MCCGGDGAAKGEKDAHYLCFPRQDPKTEQILIFKQASCAAICGQNNTPGGRLGRRVPGPLGVRVVERPSPSSVTILSARKKLRHTSLPFVRELSAPGYLQDHSFDTYLQPANLVNSEDLYVDLLRVMGNETHVGIIGTHNTRAYLRNSLLLPCST